MTMEKRGVIEEGRTPPEHLVGTNVYLTPQTLDDLHKFAGDDTADKLTHLEEDPTKRLADQVADKTPSH